MQILKSIGKAARTTRMKVAVSGATVVAAVLSIAGVSGATSTLETTFDTTQTSIMTELGYGAALLVAILLFVIGITVLVKWARKGSKMTA